MQDSLDRVFRGRARQGKARQDRAAILEDLCRWPCGHVRDVRVFFLLFVDMHVRYCKLQYHGGKVCFVPACVIYGKLRAPVTCRDGTWSLCLSRKLFPRQKKNDSCVHRFCLSSRDSRVVGDGTGLRWEISWRGGKGGSYFVSLH